MAEHWQELIANFAVTALFIVAWMNLRGVFAGRPRVWRNASFGAVMGVGAAASMLLALPIEPGVFFDLRSSLLAISGFFGGPVSAVITTIIAGTHRLAMGGTGAGAGVAAIALSAATGIAVSTLTRGRAPALGAVGVLSAAVFALCMVLSVMLRRTVNEASIEMALPVALLNAAATAVSALFIAHRVSLERERDLLRAAFVQSQDLRYVKTVEGRYIAANTVMVATLGLGSRANIVGKTDRDILPADLVEDVIDDDRRVLATGAGYLDREEVFTAPDGEQFWYASSKEPLRNGDGEIIGIGGGTRDITARRRLEREVVESRNQLNYVLSEMSDGIAMFDGEAVLVYCNDQYRSFFPLTAEVRCPGRHLRDILAAVAETGEQKGIPPGTEPQWIEEVVATLKTGGEQEIEVSDGRWLHVRTRPTADGAALVVVSDVSKIKEAETALLGMTAQLRELATTDGLTGLTNRRAFDQALETELQRCRRTMQPLSLLMIDVDRFKGYNDIYGHQAGDAVLKAVGDSLRSVLKRPGDVVARYGGEEFVAILPGTEEDGAFFIADSLRESLRALELPHAGAVTASIGIAVFTEREAGLSAAELVRRADEALYTAKGAGRDRVTGWTAHSAIQPVRNRSL